MSAHPRAKRSPELVPFALAGCAVATAGGAQLLVHQHPGWSLAGFALGGVLIALAARRLPAVPETAPAAPPAFGGVCRALLCAGTLLCGLAGVLVYQGQPPGLTHPMWVVGLVALAGAATPRLPDVRPARWPARQTLVCGGLLMLAALIVFFGWDLPGLPVEVHSADAEVGLDAVRLLHDFNLFSAGWQELPRFHAFPTAVGFELFGINLLGLRATSAALGVGSVLLLFAVARRLWGVEVAVLAGLLLASQRFFIHLSRAGDQYIDTPFLSLLVVWLFLRLWQDRRRGAAIWCGIALGLGLQTYDASRLVPGLLALTWLWWLAGTPTTERRGWIVGLGVIALVALAVAAPMFGYFAHDWRAFWEGARTTSLFSPALRPHLATVYHTDNFTTMLLTQLRAAVTLFNATPDHSGQYGLHGPLFEPVSAALFVLGAALVLDHLRERRARLALLWTIVPLVVGAALTIETPVYPRISGLVPFAVLLVALALQALRDAVRAAVPTRWGTRLLAALTVGVMALVAANNLRSYFVDYAARYRRSPSIEIAAWVRAHGGGKTTYMVGGAPAFSIRHGALAFLTHGYDTRDIDDLDDFLQMQSLDPAADAFIIMPNGTHDIPRLEQAVGPIDLQTHRNRAGRVAFLTAIPRGHGSEPADAADRFDQARASSPGIATLGRLLDAIAVAAQGLLAAAGLAVIALALIGWARRPHQPGVAALAEPVRQRVARWQRWLFGPDGREARAALPPVVVAGLLVAIAAGALALRVYHLVDLPAGFFCDEAGNGYNAYSLLHTGRDETGAWLPLYVWSFGVSYKNPIFLYSAMLPTALLGPTEVAVRLTAALYGFGTVVAMFVLGRALMGATVGLLAALLLAICPWHLHFSRIGFELITLPFFFTLAVSSLVRWTQGRRTLAQAMVLFGLCLYTYVPAKLIVPLFLAGFAVLYWRPLRARWRETALAAGLLVLTAAPVAIFDLTHREQAGSYFRDTTLLARPDPPLALVRQFAANYTAFFSPEFLFEDSDDRIIRHRVGGHGELYPFFAPLLVLGAAAALLRRDRAMRLPLLWLGLYPLAPALMNEIPSASRGILGAPAFCLVAAIGAGTILRLAARVSERRAVALAAQAALALGGVAVLVPAVQHYWTLYRDDYASESAKYYTGFQYGHRQVVDYFRRHYDEYDLLLLTTRKSNQPDVFLRFYDGLQQPPRTDIMPPFEHREKMLVGGADAYVHYAQPGQHMLFAVVPDEVPLFADAEERERILAPDGSAAFVIVSASGLKDFVSTWRVARPVPETDRSTPPAWTPDDPPRGAGAARWQTYDKPFAGVGLNGFFVQDTDHACTWAVNFVTTETERDVRVWTGFADSGEVWVNGEPVDLEASDRDTDESLIDSQTGMVHLRPGRNSIAVRACKATADWRFYFRLENPDGTTVDGLQWEYGPRAAAPA